MKLLTELSEDDKGTPIELANAILNLPMANNTDDLEAIIGHLSIGLLHMKMKQCRGEVCAPVALL